MVSVIVRKREFYKLGYPYNSDVDILFQDLTDEQKNILNDINVINDVLSFKNELFEFDKKIVGRIYYVNENIYDFEYANKDKIEEYDKKYSELVDLKNEYNSLNEELKTKENEKQYYEELKVKLSDELEYLESLISNISERLNIVDDIDIETISVDINNRINILQNSVIEFDNEKSNLLESLYNELTNYSIIVQNMVNNYSEYCVVLHIHYNEWIKRYESEYYKFLVDYFTPDYENCGTYGEHLLLDEKLKELESYQNKFNLIKNDLVSLYVRYDDLVSELNSLKYIKENLNLINTKNDYDNMLKEQKIKNYNEILANIKIDMDNINSELKEFVTDSELEFYNQYIDTANKIIRYVLTNKDNIDEDIINDYKQYLEEHRGEFDTIKKKLNDKDYLQKKIMYEVLSKEYARVKYFIELTTLNKNVEIDSDENLIELKEQLMEYLSEKDKKVSDLEEIDGIISSLNLDISILNDNILKLKVTIDGIEQELEILKNELLDIFEKYLNDVYYDENLSEYENFKSIYLYKFNKLLYKDEINELKEKAYDKFSLLYNKILIDNLFDAHYNKYNDWLNEVMTKYYNTQIKMNFYIDKYLVLLNELLNEKIQDMFGKILKYLYSNEYSETIESEMEEISSLIKEIFNELCDNKTDNFVIKYVSDMHDYSIMSEISDCNEDVKNEFYQMLDLYVDYVKFINNKWLEYEERKIEDSKIEKFWDNWS